MNDKITGDRLLGSYSFLIALVCVAGLIFVFLKPPASMKTDRDGIAHFTPSVINPETGEAIDMNDLVRHFKGD